MTEIIDNINNAFNASAVCKGVHVYGICKLVTKTDQPHPIDISDNKQISPDDKVEGQIYHRLLNDSPITDDLENSFGSKIQKRHSQQIRTVVLVKKLKGENWIDTLINLIPRNIDGITNYKLIDIGSISKNTDQDAIFNTEFGNSGYEKHRMTYLIYALEYNLEYIRCA